MSTRMCAFEGTASYHTRFRPPYPNELIGRLAAFVNLRRDVDRVLDLGATSFASLIRLGDRRDAFEAAARERLKPQYRERVRVDAIIGTQP